MENNTPRTETQAERDARYAAEDAAWGPSNGTSGCDAETTWGGNSECVYQENDRQHWNI